MWALALLVIVFAIVMGYTVSARMAEQKRRAEVKAWAQQHGWDYSDWNDGVLSYFDDVSLANAEATEVVTGVVGKRRAMAFCCECPSPSGSDPIYKRIVAVAMPCGVGHLAIKPEGLAAKLGDKLGLAKVQLESEAFNKAFRLTASSQKLAYDLMPTGNIELLIGHLHTGLHTDRGLLVMIEDGRLAASKLDGSLELLSAFIDNVPSFAWKDHDASRSADEPPAT